jgi:hypothetical protein
MVNLENQDGCLQADGLIRPDKLAPSENHWMLHSIEVELLTFGRVMYPDLP